MLRYNILCHVNAECKKLMNILKKLYTKNVSFLRHFLFYYICTSNLYHVFFKFTLRSKFGLTLIIKTLTRTSTYMQKIFKSILMAENFFFTLNFFKTQLLPSYLPTLYR